MSSAGGTADVRRHGEALTDVGRGVTLCHERFGDPDDRPLLLVPGLGQQHFSYPDELCEALAGRGLHVVRIDNRDVGRSWRAPTPPPRLRRILLGRFPAEQYTLADMADDAAGLLRALGIAPAHVAGVSMGGMIVQTLAARHPDAVRSVVSIMSNTGARLTGRPAPSTLPRLLSGPARDRDEAIERAVSMFRHVGSHGFPFDEARVRADAARAFDRAHHPAGVGRQMAAILKSGDRTAELRRITAPTLVVHGDRDRMVHPSGARATARAIPGARLETIVGLGHDLPAGAWPRLAELVADHADRADGATT
ncbi:MAG: alpha/beta fold hydrolase [Solirubrobacteraceae bacterium]|nr:alpha/beta fold hydrolase [Solirubrobacteraceae bacterium]